MKKLSWTTAGIDAKIAVGTRMRACGYSFLRTIKDYDCQSEFTFWTNCANFAIVQIWTDGEVVLYKQVSDTEQLKMMEG